MASVYGNRAAEGFAIQQHSHDFRVIHPVSSRSVDIVWSELASVSKIVVQCGCGIHRCLSDRKTVVVGLVLINGECNLSDFPSSPCSLFLLCNGTQGRQQYR